MFTESHHYLRPLEDKLNALKASETRELEKVQAILQIADETVKDIVAKGAARAALFDDVAKSAQASRGIGLSDNTMRLRDDEQNILFSRQLSDPHEVARTKLDEGLAIAVKELRGISRDSPIAGVSATHQRVAPLRSALSVALREHDPSSMRNLAQHSNPKTKQRLTNLKNAAKLFENLGQIQREHLEPIEKKMLESPFVLPFHVPFVFVTNLIRNELLTHKTGEKIEEEFEALFTSLDCELNAAYDLLDPENRGEDDNSSGFFSPSNAAAGFSRPAAGAALTQDQARLPSAKECFITLQNEMQERAALHDQCMGLLENSKEIEREGREFLAPLVNKTRDHAMQSLEEISVKSEDLRKVARAAREQLEESLSVRVVEREKTIDASNARIAELEKAAFQNRMKQEKAVRRMREEIKSLVKLQGEHKTIVEEIGNKYAERVENEVLLEGLRLACATRCDRLAAAEKSCSHSTAISMLTKKQLEAVLSQCQSHIARVTSQEFSRCSRIATKTVRNCSQWYRSLGDLLAIRSSRLQKIIHRGEEGGWQVQFLQKNELSAQEAAVSDIDRMRIQIEKFYPALSRSVLSLDVDCPSLKFVDQGDPTAARRRQIFLSAPDAGRDRLLREGKRELNSTEKSQNSALRSRNSSKNSTATTGVKPEGEQQGPEDVTTHFPQLVISPRGGNSNSSSSATAAASGGNSNYQHHHHHHVPRVLPAPAVTEELPPIFNNNRKGTSSQRPDSQGGSQGYVPEPPPRRRF